MLPGTSAGLCILWRRRPIGCFSVQVEGANLGLL